MGPSIAQYVWRVANIAIGSTTLRNQGAAGVNRAARTFLSGLSVVDFVCDSAAEFSSHLNKQTLLLKRSLPPEAQHWGTARKGLNLFLGEVYYHRVLCEHFRMEKIATFLEVPLDNNVVRFLKGKAAIVGTKLPRWKTIKSLNPLDSQNYQDFAKQYVADRGEGWIRLHVDLLAWRSLPENREAEQNDARERL
jgi:hypothetical protein